MSEEIKAEESKTEAKEPILDNPGLAKKLRQQVQLMLDAPLNTSNWSKGDAVKFYQLALDLETEAKRQAAEVEPGNNIPGQAEAARGKRYFFTYLAGRFPHIEDVFRLMGQGWDWRKAIYITWLATPKKYRQPKTQELLAVDYLNLTSQRTFSTWRNDKSWPIEETAIKLARERATSPGPERLAAVIEAMYDTGAMVGREGTGDRKMILELIGLLGGQADGSGDKSGDDDNLDQLADDELRAEEERLARILTQQKAA